MEMPFTVDTEVPLNETASGVVMQPDRLAPSASPDATIAILKTFMQPSPWFVVFARTRGREASYKAGLATSCRDARGRVAQASAKLKASAGSAAPAAGAQVRHTWYTAIPAIQITIGTACARPVRASSA